LNFSFFYKFTGNQPTPNINQKSDCFQEQPPRYNLQLRSLSIKPLPLVCGFRQNVTIYPIYIDRVRTYPK